MAKKIALFFSLIMIFSLSFVFASEDTSALVNSAPASGEEVILTSGENVEVISGEVSEDAISGENEIATEPTDDLKESGETIVPSEDAHDHDHDHEEESNSTMVGAIVAIIIVVAVVAIVAVIQKK